MLFPVKYVTIKDVIQKDNLPNIFRSRKLLKL